MNPSTISFILLYHIDNQNFGDMMGASPEEELHSLFDSHLQGYHAVPFFGDFVMPNSKERDMQEDYQEIAQEVAEHKEWIDHLERQIGKLLDLVAKLREEIAWRKQLIKELQFQAVSDYEGDIVCCADLMGQP